MKLQNHQYTLLTEEQIRLIHEKSLEVLERVGVRIMSEHGLEILRSNGCDVSDYKRVKIPRELIMRGLKTAPNRIDVFDRDGELAMTLESGSVYFGTGGDTPFTIDLETGERRPALKEDTARLTRFCDALPNIDFIMSMGVATDTPPISRHIHQYEAMLLNTTKPCVGSGDSPAVVKAQIEMAAAAVGGLGKLRERPILIFLNAPRAPLTHPKEDLEQCLVCAEYGVPFIYDDCSMLGSTGPVTLAGAITQANANALAGMTIIQLAYPGAKYIHSFVCPATDMRYGTFSYGSPELTISCVAMADISLFYNLPCWGFGAMTDSKLLDAQAGLEYVFSTYMPARSGVTLMHDCGYLDGGMTSSFEGPLLAEEIISQMKYYLKPIQVSESTIALDIIEEVGPGGTYLTHPHTAHNFRKHMWFPRYIFRGPFAEWEKKGAKDIRARLNEAAKKLFAEHQLKELPEDAKNKIADIVKNFEQET